MKEKANIQAVDKFFALCLVEESEGEISPIEVLDKLNATDLTAIRISETARGFLDETGEGKIADRNRAVGLKLLGQSLILQNPQHKSEKK